MNAKRKRAADISIKIDTDIAELASSHAINEGLTKKGLIEKAIRQYVQKATAQNELTELKESIELMRDQIIHINLESAFAVEILSMNVKFNLREEGETKLQELRNLAIQKTEEFYGEKL